VSILEPSFEQFRIYVAIRPQYVSQQLLNYRIDLLVSQYLFFGLFWPSSSFLLVLWFLYFLAFVLSVLSLLIRLNIFGLFRI
jgi:hypothetical protein